jgi:hypothetical protein
MKIWRRRNMMTLLEAGDMEKSWLLVLLLEEVL